VVIPLVTQHWGMLRRNLVYAAVTRGRRPVVVVGQPKAPALAVRGGQARRRWAKLKDRLGGEAGRLGPSEGGADDQDLLREMRHLVTPRLGRGRRFEADCALARNSSTGGRAMDGRPRP
jgi:hypothetical protein